MDGNRPDIIQGAGRLERKIFTIVQSRNLKTLPWADQVAFEAIGGLQFRHRGLLFQSDAIQRVTLGNRVSRRARFFGGRF